MDLVGIAKEVIETEVQGLQFMASNIGEEFERAVDAILMTKGRTIVCGMGKSGIIGKKIASSFASTGTSAFFMHPGEAFHGDLGMISSSDVFVAISNSGETDEVLKLLPFLRDNGNYIISITGNSSSTLAVNSHCHLSISVPKEACPLQLAPTTSTTATLVLGDALTVALMRVRNFKPENFARFHPGGSLGRRLLGKVQDEMFKDNLPFVKNTTSIPDLIHTMSSGKQGLAIVYDNGSLQGVLTDGDLRRSMEKFQSDIFSKTVIDICSKKAVVISPDASILNATELMTKKCVNSLIVVDDKNVVGVLKKL
ncbi:MAG: arabinose-5-phosphate isomerase [Oleiphilaceae bacterium]|jgi:arabinose-5-phosphate isomerase